jgi:hypothetical protein
MPGVDPSGFPAAWTGWTSIVVGALAVAGAIAARPYVTCPELPLVVPVVIGVGLLPS